LLSEGMTDRESGVPLLKDLPLLGLLFKSTHKQKTKTELVIMLTPMILDADIQAGLVRDGDEIIRASFDEHPGIDGRPADDQQWDGSAP
ncbi:hypothetical protein DRQ50_13710, partial [bacterium]